VSVTEPPSDGEPLVGLQLEPTGKDVAGDVGGAAAGGIRVRPQPDQCLGRLDFELSHKHSGGLADLGSGQRIEFRPRVAAGVGHGGLEVSVEKVEERNARQFGRDDRASELLGRQLNGVTAEQVKGADVLAGDDEGHRERAADVVGQQSRPERGPATFGGIGEVDDEDGSSSGDRFQTRPLAEGELQFVVLARRLAAATQRSAGSAVEDQGDGRGVDFEKEHARLAEAIGRLRAALSADGCNQLLLNRHI
jgi:hypothetical protein